MPKEPTVCEEKDGDGKIILRVEGEDNYYSYCPYDRIELRAKAIKGIITTADESSISEVIIFDAVCDRDRASLAVIGAPETSTRNIECKILRGINSEDGRLVMIGWVEGEWECEIYVPEELNQKLIDAYRSNRIANLIIGVMASRPADEKPNRISPDKDHLWREGSSWMEPRYEKGDPLFLRPFDNRISCAYAYWSFITYTDPYNTTESINMGKEEEKSDKKDSEIKHPNPFSQDELSAKLSELNSTISDVKKYITLGVICLFVITIMLML